MEPISGNYGMDNKTGRKSIWRRIKNFPSRRSWKGVAGLVALLTLLAGVILAVVGFISSHFPPGLNGTHNVTAWLSEAIAFVVPRYVLLSVPMILAAMGVLLLRPYLSSSKSYPLVGLDWIAFVKRGIAVPKKKFVSIPIPASIANDYLKDRFPDLPAHVVTPDDDKVKFQLDPDAFILDTNKTIYDVLPRDHRWEEFGFSLRKPRSHIKSVCFLISSGNSLKMYQSFRLGQISLVFKDAPPIITDLVLGQNIREGCIGNPGSLVREVSDHVTNKPAWRGKNKDGVAAIMDCLKIPVYASMRNYPLEEIIFAHNKAALPPDNSGVHFIVFAVSLEIE
jgi:hypothetical protein